MKNENGKIILVDDDQYVLDSTATLLRISGLNVTALDSGERLWLHWMRNDTILS